MRFFEVLNTNPEHRAFVGSCSASLLDVVRVNRCGVVSSGSELRTVTVYRQRVSILSLRLLRVIADIATTCLELYMWKVTRQQSALALGPRSPTQGVRPASFNALLDIYVAPEADGSRYARQRTQHVKQLTI